MIKIESLGFAYKNKKVFDDLSLELKAGHIYGLLGKNGAGKSTLLRTIMGLLYPDSGRIDVFGHQPEKRKPAFLSEVFLVAEEFYLPSVFIKSFVKSNAPFYPNFSQEQFWHYLSEFEIPKDNRLDEMSYGQKKKLLISFALACNTRLLLMDEPTNGLDILSKSQFRKVMAGVITEDKCIVISTHQVRDLEALIDFVTITYDGKIQFHQHVDRIGEMLTFGFSMDSLADEDIIYSESQLMGQAYVKRRSEKDMGSRAGKIDLELLYKAVSLHPNQIDLAFNRDAALI